MSLDLSTAGTASPKHQYPCHSFMSLGEETFRPQPRQYHLQQLAEGASEIDPTLSSIAVANKNPLSRFSMKETGPRIV